MYILFLSSSQITKVIHLVNGRVSISPEPHIPQDGRSEYGEHADFGKPAVGIISYPTGLTSTNAVSSKESVLHSRAHVF